MTEGTHPTTQLCRSFLTESTRRRRVASMLDVGTGDGTLALHAARLGVRNVVAVDRAPEQARLAKGRVVAAGLADVVDVRPVAVSSVAGAYDLVVANLSGDDLAEAATDLARLTTVEGELFCCGMRLWQAHAIRRSLEAAGLHSVGVRAAGGWGALQMRRPREV